MKRKKWTTNYLLNTTQKTNIEQNSTTNRGGGNLRRSRKISSSGSVSGTLKIIQSRNINGARNREYNKI